MYDHYLVLAIKTVILNAKLFCFVSTQSAIKSYTKVGFHLCNTVM